MPSESNKIAGIKKASLQTVVVLRTTGPGTEVVGGAWD